MSHYHSPRGTTRFCDTFLNVSFIQTFDSRRFLANNPFIVRIEEYLEMDDGDGDHDKDINDYGSDDNHAAGDGDGGVGI